jgi:hypothetical protein
VVHETYDYLTARIAKGRLGDVRRFLAEDGRDRVRQAGGTLWGCWLGAGSIGWADDQLIAVVAWPAAPPASGDASAWLSEAPASGVADVDAERLRATIRPEEPHPLRAGGVLAHRWFELEDPADFDELLTLSAEAWPAFESAYEASIEGFFRSVGDPREVLLVTRYASLAEWERSRQVRQADTGDLAEARRRFVRRQQLTRRQVVRIGPLLPV